MARRVLGAFAVTTTAVLASLAFATPANAHTPTVKVDCDEKAQKSVLTVDLKDYNQNGDNTLTVEIDGEQVKKTNFRKGLSRETFERDSKTKHTYKVTVFAHDDPSFESKPQNWSRVFDLSNDKCVKTPPTKTTKPEPTPPTKTTSPSSEAPSSSVVPPSSTPAAPAPGGSQPEPPLAATGASPLWLLLSGVGLVGAGAATVLFVRRRRA